MKALYSRHELPADVEIDPRVESLVEDHIGCVADKWTMLILETLVGSGTLRFLSRLIGGIRQKMLIQTVRRMERDGLLARKVYPVMPPKLGYKLTDLGSTHSAAFCRVRVWAAENLWEVEESRARFDKKATSKVCRADVRPESN